MRRDGYRIPTGGAKGFLARLEAVRLPEHLRLEIQPLLDVMKLLDLQIADADKQLARHVATDPVARRLSTVPGVGPVTAVTFTAVLDTCERFGSAREVRAYAGLVPREMSSGERQQRGRITKAGNNQLRSLLVEVAWCVMRTRKAEPLSLQQWAQRIAARRGKRIASVALARKLAGVLYAMWRDSTEFGQPKNPARPPATPLAA